MVLFIALVVMIAMTMAGIALTRSVATSNLIAGNLGFQQSATYSCDSGIETAVAWLENNTAAFTTPDAANGYAASSPVSGGSPAAGQSWNAFWTQTLASQARTLAADSSGNTVSYAIQRLCLNDTDTSTSGNCSVSPSTVSAGEGTDLSSDAPEQQGAPMVYFRITARSIGPRNTVSMVQAIVAL